MAKFTDPTGKGVIYLNQNYHGENTTAIDTQCAIDIRMNANEFYHSVCYGTVEKITTDLNGYMSVIPDSLSARVLYVHTDRPLVKVGDRVIPGQRLGQIQDITGCHLHLGMKNKDNSKNPPQIMDYFDRSLVFRTTYQDIANDWFNGKIGGDINWSLFSDKQYGIVTPQVDPQITELQNELSILKTTNNSLNEQIVTLNGQIKSANANCDELKNEYKILSDQYGTLMIERNTLENDKNEAIKELNDCKNGRWAWVISLLEKLFPIK